MIGRLRLRDDFRRLRREGRTVRRGPLRLVHCATGAGPDTGTRVAYAIPRTVGSAVVRNRIRRRLRAILVERDRRPGGVPTGDYLVRVSPAAATSSYAELDSLVAEALDALADRATNPTLDASLP